MCNKNNEGQSTRREANGMKESNTAQNATLGWSLIEYLFLLCAHGEVSTRRYSIKATTLSGL